MGGRHLGMSFWGCGSGKDVDAFWRRVVLVVQDMMASTALDLYSESLEQAGLRLVHNWNNTREPRRPYVAHLYCSYDESMMVKLLPGEGC